MQEAADMIILRAKDMTIACRVRGRKKDYSEQYPWDITIRAQRDSGSKTELRKLCEGWGDWMFYGHAHEDQKSFCRWLLIDLHVWRREYLLRAVAEELDGKARGTRLQKIPNHDGTHLVAINVLAYPTELIIASSHVTPRELRESA